jgi:hypothetical protein
MNASALSRFPEPVAVPGELSKDQISDLLVRVGAKAPTKKPARKSYSFIKVNVNAQRRPP